MRRIVPISMNYSVLGGPANDAGARPRPSSEGHQRLKKGEPITLAQPHRSGTVDEALRRGNDRPSLVVRTTRFWRGAEGFLRRTLFDGPSCRVPARRPRCAARPINPSAVNPNEPGPFARLSDCLLAVDDFSDEGGLVLAFDLEG